MKIKLSSTFILFRFFAGKCLLFLLLFIQTQNLFSIDNFANYKQCWVYQTDKLTAIAPVSNGTSLILPLSNAELLNLDFQTGNVNWKAELGGEIVAEPVSTGNLLIVATKAESTGESSGKGLLTIRALSINTGLTIWQKDFSDAEKTSLALNNDKLIFATRKSSNETLLSALNAANGAAAWSKTISSELTTDLFTAVSNVYFGTNDKSIYSIRVADGVTSKQLKIGNEAQNKLLVSNGVIFYGDSKGDIAALREADSNELWILRTGGAVQDILPTERGLLVTSLDNFVYLHKYSSGERQWRRRLAARPLNAALINNETALLLTNGESSAIIIRLKNGKILSQIPIGENNYAISAANITDKFIFLPSKDGVLGLFQNTIPCGKSAEKEKGAK